MKEYPIIKAGERHVVRFSEPTEMMLRFKSYYCLSKEHWEEWVDSIRELDSAVIRVTGVYDDESEIRYVASNTTRFIIPLDCFEVYQLENCVEIIDTGANFF